MINKETVNALLSGVFKRKQTAFDKRMTHPLRDWFIGVAVFVLIIASGGAYSALRFVEYRSIATDENVSQDPVVEYNEVLVGNMITQYQTRRQLYDAQTQSTFIMMSEETPAFPPTDTSSSTSTAAAEEEQTEESETPPLEEVMIAN